MLLNYMCGCKKRDHQSQDIHEVTVGVAVLSSVGCSDSIDTSKQGD